MLLFRSILFTLGMTVATVIFSIIALLTIPFSRLTRYSVITQWSHFVIFWLRVTCGITFRVTGREHIPAQPAIILAKHQSAWETIAFQLIFPPQSYVLKRELLWIPFFGWGLALTSPIAINRAAGRDALKRLIAAGRQRLQQGFWVVIFPEGTRMLPGQRGEYAAGGAFLATQTGAPVVPVAHNAGQFWGKNSFLKRPGEITVAIGPAIPSAGRKASQINAEAEAWIEAQMPRLEAPPAALAAGSQC